MSFIQTLTNAVRIMYEKNNDLPSLIFPGMNTACYESSILEAFASDGQMPEWDDEITEEEILEIVDTRNERLTYCMYSYYKARKKLSKFQFFPNKIFKGYFLLSENESEERV